MAYHPDKPFPLSPRQVKLLCTWFGAGLSRKAPGTAGSLAALPFAYVLHLFGNDVLLWASIILFFVGCRVTEEYLKHSDSKDPKEVVIDEVAGQWFLLSFFFPTFNSYVVGFLMFRFFDVLKPWPVSWVDRNVKGSLGVMLDDMAAAFLPFVAAGGLIIIAKLSGVEDIFTGFMQFMGAPPDVQ